MDGARRRSAWAVAFFVLSVAVLAAAGSSYRSTSEARNESEAELWERRKRIRTLEAAAAHLDEFKQETELLDSRVERARRHLPPAPDPRLLESLIREAAREAGVGVDGILRGPFRGREQSQEIPVSIEVRGAPAAIAGFGEALSSAPRLLAVRQVEVEPRGAELWARFDVRAFYSAQPEEGTP